MFAIYDSKGEAFDKPFFMRTKGEAVRGWINLANDKETSIGRYPSDYTLFELADVDCINGVVIPHEAKISLGTALEHIRPQESQPKLKIEKNLEEFESRN